MIIKKRMTRVSGVAAVAALLVFVTARDAWPQASTSTVSGTVRDQTDAVIPNAAVTLINTATNVRFETQTNEVGFYVFPGIIPGPYKLEASSTGMAKYEVTLVVQVTQKITVDPILKPATTNTTDVVVADATPLVNVTDSTLGRVIDRTQLEQLPGGRDFRGYIVNTVPASSVKGIWCGDSGTVPRTSNLTGRRWYPAPGALLYTGRRDWIPSRKSA